MTWGDVDYAHGQELGLFLNLSDVLVVGLFVALVVSHFVEVRTCFFMRIAYLSLKYHPVFWVPQCHVPTRSNLNTGRCKRMTPTIPLQCLLSRIPFIVYRGESFAIMMSQVN